MTNDNAYTKLWGKGGCMEYNKSKKVLEKIAGILGIISASIYMIAAIVLVINAFAAFGGAYDYEYYDYYYGMWMYEDRSYLGIPFMVIGIPLLAMAILMLIFSIQIVKSPYLPNGELRKKQPARIWVLVLSILMGDLVVMGLMIAVLCLKDFKEANAQQQDVSAQNNMYAQNPLKPTVQLVNDQKEFYEFYEKIK